MGIFHNFTETGHDVASQPHSALSVIVITIVVIFIIFVMQQNVYDHVVLSSTCEGVDRR